MSPLTEQACRMTENAIENHESYEVIIARVRRLLRLLSLEQGEIPAGKGEVEKRVRACRETGVCGGCKE